jgi:DNA invertase Pin-like site-specific DNA recombinase
MTRKQAREVARLLAIIRLSKGTDTTNSPSGQRDDISDYTQESGDIIVKWIKEIDISGGMPMRERPGVGPWLEDDRLGEWDGIIGARLDRLFRSQLDFLLWVRDFCIAKGKIIIDVEGDIDTSTPQGIRTLNDRAQRADYERQRIAENRSKAQKRIRLDGRYSGGPIPFGYMKKKVLLDEDEESYGYILIPHPEYSTYLIEIVNRILAGESANSICNDFNRRGIPTSFDAQRIMNGRKSRGGKWQSNQMLKMLRSPALKGVVLEYVKKGAKWSEPVPRLGRNGMPVMRDALISEDTWNELQEIIGKPNDHSHYRINAITLQLGVAFCLDCGRKYQGTTKTNRTRTQERHYYACAGIRVGECKARFIPIEKLDAALEAFMASIGHFDDFDTKRASTGANRERRIKEIGEQIVNLTTERFVQGVMRPDYDTMMESLQTEQNRVRLEPEPELEPERIKTGKTVQQAWNERDIQEKRRWLVKHGIKVYAKRHPDDRRGMPASEPIVIIDGGEFAALIEAAGGPTLDEMLAPYRELAEAIQGQG